ncbi:hypothetical protein Enr13x_68370 [Stieleria neptunia]|uniref:Uncharacterized protein n=1 Tax=Stieleria neptunia TaxID=2527979 RepID=A0A518I1G9_9BACT|nr:hypothetical protein [Stieleria neptunia]QDV46928.1 hypothetical protein Enr13x_68370 [Stieleria neptunia]
MTDHVQSAVIAALVSLFLLSSTTVGVAQQQTAVAETTAETTADAVVVGINGHYRVGRPTAIRLAEAIGATMRTEAGTPSPFTLETLDGDGVRVRYGMYPNATEDSDAIELGYVVPGSEAAPLTIERTTEAGTEVIVQTRFPAAGRPASGPSMIPAGMPWIVSVGDPLGVDQIGASNVLLDKAARIAVTRIDSADRLPFQSLGYDGVDMVMVNASGVPVLQAMVGEQTDALVSWLRRGGHLFVCLGEATERTLQAAPWLASLLPVEDVTLSRYDPAAFETFTSSQTPLDVFQGIKLPRREGRVLISGRTTRRVSAVLGADYVIGLGHATVVTADLDAPRFAQWPERLDLVKQVVGDLLEEQTGERDGRTGSTSFSDLAGQMRGVLDQFAIKPRFSFSVVSVVVMLLIALIGPLDYLLINRVWGKPLLGWVSFPLMAIALSVLLVIQAAPQTVADAAGTGSANPDAAGAASATSALLRANQFQVTDIDLVDGAGRGFAWCSLYSHDPARVDVRYGAREAFELLEPQPLGQPGSTASRSFVFPMGYPGRAFGGIQLAGENTVFDEYSVVPSTIDSDVGRGVKTELNGLTIAPRSSKSIAARCSFAADTDRAVSVIRRPGSELLRGALVNPLPYDLLDGVLIYGNWVYLLPTRVPAGSSVAELSELRQKNFRWRLTRQQSADQSTTATTPWSPSDFSDAKRVAEMILFHRAAGGELFTGLGHHVLGDLDLSELLVEDRCLLMGRTEKPLFELEVKETMDGSAGFIQPGGQVLSMVRVVVPVRSTRLN